MSVVPSAIQPQIPSFLASLTTPNPLFNTGLILPRGYKNIFEKYQHIFIPIVRGLIEDNDPKILEKTQNIFFEIIKEILRNTFLLENKDIDSLFLKTPKIFHPLLPPDHLKYYQVYVIAQFVEKEVSEFLNRFESELNLETAETKSRMLRGGISSIAREQEWQRYRTQRFEKSWEDGKLEEASVIASPRMPICTYHRRPSYYDHVVEYIQTTSQQFIQNETQERKDFLESECRRIFSLFRGKYHPPSPTDPNVLEEDHLLFLSACTAIKTTFLDHPKNIFEFFGSHPFGAPSSPEEKAYWSSLEIWFLHTLEYF